MTADGLAALLAGLQAVVGWYRRAVAGPPPRNAQDRQYAERARDTARARWCDRLADVLTDVDPEHRRVACECAVTLAAAAASVGVPGRHQHRGLLGGEVLDGEALTAQGVIALRAYLECVDLVVPHDPGTPHPDLPVRDGTADRPAPDRTQRPVRDRRPGDHPDGDLPYASSPGGARRGQLAAGLSGAEH